MGAFFLSRRGAAADLAKAKVIEAFKQQGFEQIQEHSGEAYNVLHCLKVNAPTDSFYARDSENFCLTTGTLIYRHQIGAAAARCLFEDTLTKRLDTAELFGNFALCLCVAGRLQVFNDPQGVYNIWHDLELNYISSSFPAMLAISPKLTVNPAAVYQQVYQEATFGGDTVFAELRRLQIGRSIEYPADRNALARFAEPLTVKSVDTAARGFAEHLEISHSNLQRQFAAIADCFGDSIDSALSGGYDSRLALALCREQGVTPHLHVYGGDDSADVRVAKAVCQGEGIPLQHDNKMAFGDIEPDQFATVVEQNWQAFQGNCADGVLDNGADLKTRKSRTQSGRLLLNGGGGEVFRNFFYLPDRRYRIRDLVWSFYNRFDPATATEAFSEEEFFADFERKIAQQLQTRWGTSDEPLDRAMVEYLYAGFRCTYWMGQNNSINNQFGWFLTPYVDENIALSAYQIPLSMKNFGRFQGALINRVSPALAAYQSDYGHNFAGDVPLKRKLKEVATMLRPPQLRRYTYRLKKRSRESWQYFLGQPYIQQILPDGFSYMSRYFQVDKIDDAEQYKRLCTLEYLFQKVNAIQP